jgi:SagB-type dehydrogenase family enzyme
MPLETLSTLLWAANGLTRQAELPPDGVSCLNRSVPSAGGLYPLEVYPLVQRVEATPGGLYHYGVWGHTLEPVRTGATFEDFRSATLAYPFFEDANVVLFVAAVFARTQRKYGPRGYRYILLEAGHAAQNICLAATGKGLGSLCIGGYLDGKLNRMLGLDAAKEGVVYAVAAGFPAPAVSDPGDGRLQALAENP